MAKEINSSITRRDFVKGTLLGSGSMLLNMPAPIFAESANQTIHPWNGYAGVGDYARSNGNTESTRSAAHLIRDHKIDEILEGAIDTGESYDLVIIGGGFAGLSAAHTFRKEAKQEQTCLLLENHHLPGGEAKRNEFIVDGHKISGPQGSNLTVVPFVKGDWYDKLFDELEIPRDPTFQKLEGHKGEIRLSPTNYLPMLGIAEQAASAGYFFDKETFDLEESYWDIDSSQNGYANTAFSDAEKSDLEHLRMGTGVNKAGDDWPQWLDSITYREYLEDVLNIQPRVIKVLDTTLSTTSGMGSDAISARYAMMSALPGFDKGFGDKSLYRVPADDKEVAGIFAFPGGNDGIYRLLLKKVLPQAIAGNSSFENIHDSPYQFEKFDNAQSPMRIRLGSTAVRVAHDGEPGEAKSVSIYYQKNGKVYRVKATAVVSAIGGWVNKHIIQDLPAEYSKDFGKLIYGSNMIINVALRNWRPMAKLGISACHFFNDTGIGGYCNIKRPMVFGDNPPPLNPDKPIVLTFYVGFPKPGLPAKEQAAAIRWELLSKSYADIETAVRKQLANMFGPLGFDDEKDIAGIIVNRWGHSYVAPVPGMFHGNDGKLALQQIIDQPFGRIAFGHSEHNGLQEWFGAVEHGERAARQIMKYL
ncbi:MAG: NAD(P)-binding protein [Gammaproteobacteria bacterium]|nr:NAD(P)-binding protein [Gammaproteobacteria bacterium]